MRDGIGAVVFAAVSLVPALGSYGLELGELSGRPADPTHVVLVLAQTLPLALRRVAPAWVLAVVGAAFAIDQCAGYPPSPAGLGILFALYSAGAHQQRGRRLTVGIAVVAYVGLAVALTMLGSRELPWDFATFSLVLAGAWVIGDVARLRGSASRVRAELAARVAVTEERARVARELHDVVGHHVTGMVVQADAAAYLPGAQDALVREQFSSIAASGRRALADLRELLDVLGPDSGDGPRMPAIGSPQEIVDEARRRGQGVDFVERGNPGGPDDVRLAVYRIVQEGLTNALRHAPGAATAVDVDWSAETVRVQVATDGAAPANSGMRRRAMAAGSGRGLAGLAERVRLLGGQWRAGGLPSGGFELEAVIPIVDETTHETRAEQRDD